MKRTGCGISAAVLFLVVLLCGSFAPAGRGLRAPVCAAEEMAAEEDRSVLPEGVRKELSEGVKNILRRAWQMYDIDWSPLAELSSYSSGSTSMKLFKPGEKYKGIPYGQPVHAGAYVGFTASLPDFIAAVQEADSPLYTRQGMNTWDNTDHGGPIKYCPYYSNDCSAFVSYCWDLPKRTTTSGFAGDPATFPVVGKDLALLEPGFALNGNGHAILIYDVVYDSRGRVISVTTLEQTPPIMTLRTFGLYGNAGTLDDLQDKIDKNYDIIRYKDADSVVYGEIPGADVQERFAARIMQPVSDLAEDAAATGIARIAEDAESFPVSGWVLHEDGIVSYSYSVDGGAEQPLSGAYSSEVTGIKGYERYEDVCGLNLFSGTIPADFTGSAEIRILARTRTGEVLEAAVFAVQKGNAEIRSQSYMDVPENMQQTEDGLYTQSVTRMGKNLLVSFSGWSACATDIRRFEVCVDDGIWYPADTGFRNDVYNATPFRDCRNANSFRGGMELSYLDPKTEHRVALRAVTADNAVYEIAVWEISVSEENHYLVAAIVSLVAGIIVLAVSLGLGRRKKRGKPSRGTEAAGAGPAGESSMAAEAADAGPAAGEPLTAAETAGAGTAGEPSTAAETADAGPAAGEPLTAAEAAGTGTAPQKP